MRTTTKLFLVSLLATSATQLVTANDIEPTKEFYSVIYAPKPIVLDGDLSEWAGVPVLADPKFAVPKFSGTNASPNYVLFEQYDGGTWSGPDDQTSAVQIVYDADNVYFGFVVTDDYHENSANSAWNGDSIQLMIADATRTQQVALYNYALGGVEDALGDVIVNHEAGPAVDPDCNCATEALVRRDTVAKKTYYEIKLPAASLGLTAPLGIGTKFGLGMAINDGDSGPGQAGQKGWGGLGAHAIVFGKTPSETAEVTLGTTVSGSDRLFLSAINPGILSFSFRATDKGLSIVNPSTAKLVIDGQTVALTNAPKTLDATDFTYSRATPFPVGNHTYSIEVRDGIGNVVTDAGTFLAQAVLVLTKAQQAISVDKTKPGFIWRVFQNETFAPTDLASAELALSGELKDDAGNIVPNHADPAAVGIASAAGTLDGTLVKFEIPTVINLSQIGADLNGDFSPDDQMPGIPGIEAIDDGIDGEILTFVDLPAGLITMGVNSENGFRTQAGYVNTPADGILLGEFDGVRTPADTTFQFVVQDAGVYPLRTIWQAEVGGASVEWFTVKSDGSKVLINDAANGGFKAYSVGVAPIKPASSAFTITVANPAGVVEISWTEPGVVLQQSTDFANWAAVTGATSPYKPTIGTGTAVFYRLKK